MRNFDSLSSEHIGEGVIKLGQETRNQEEKMIHELNVREGKWHFTSRLPKSDQVWWVGEEGVQMT